MSNTSTQNPLALVVDDSGMVRRMVCAMLHHLGYATCEAADGIALLEQAARQPVDIVITDLNMPQMDGLTACRQLRLGGSRLPMIILTTYTGQDDDALAAGVNVVMHKPVTTATLKQAIDKACASAAGRSGRPAFTSAV